MVCPVSADFRTYIQALVRKAEPSSRWVKPLHTLGHHLLAAKLPAPAIGGAPNWFDGQLALPAFPAHTIATSWKA